MDGPYGVFEFPQDGVAGLVLIAGGIGAAPCMSMLRTMADVGDRRPVLFFYGNRDWESITYREELDALRDKIDLRMVHVLEKPPQDWEGEVGYINAALLDRHLPEDRLESTYFVCGPLPMMSAVEKALGQLHIPLKQIHTENYEMA